MPEASTLLKEERFYKKLDLFLNYIHNDVIRIDADRKKYCVSVTKGVVETLIEKLKCEDPVFKLFYQKISYVGSYFDGLRISDPTEFDLNIVLNLRFNYEQIKLENSKECPGHVLLNVKNVTLDDKKFNGPVLKEWKKWIDSEGYLLHDAVLRWWESILAKISEKGRYPINYNNKFYEVRSYKNGPALTLQICNKEDDLEIDVDLVPVLEFPSTRSPPHPTRWIQSGLSKKFVDDTCWAVVPKPMDDKRLWRLSFTAQEQKIMSDLRHLKYINKMLKKFRDANKLNIPSYQIKTFFIWEAYEKRQARNEDFWKKPPSYLLVYMLVKLAEALEKKELKFFWNSEMNLFNLLLRKSPVLLLNMEGQVKRIIMNLNKLIESDDMAELEKKLCSLFGVVKKDGVMKNALLEHSGAEENNSDQSDILKEFVTSSDEASSLLHPVLLDTVDSFLKPSITPKKKLPKVMSIEDPVTQQAFSSLHPTLQKDDVTAKYSVYLAEKLNQFNPHTRSILIHKINNLIFETEMAVYNSTTSSISRSDHVTSTPLISFSSSPTSLINSQSSTDSLELLKTLYID